MEVKPPLHFLTKSFASRSRRQSNVRTRRAEQIEEVKLGKGHGLILEECIKMGRGSGRISEESEKRSRARE